MSAQHPLAVFVATEAEPLLFTGQISSGFPGYDPLTQLQGNWNDVTNHLEVLCSDANTGEPSTVSHTTSYGPHNEYPDQDSDDSGT